MTDTDTDDAFLRPLRVPIIEPFAHLTSAVLTDVREVLVSTTATDPDPECLWFQQAVQLGGDEDSVANHRRALLGLGLQAANDIWQNALDLLAAIAHDVQRVPAPVWSPLSLARGVLEASLLSRYLLDPGISPKMRLARTAGLWHTDAQYELRTATAWGTPPAAGEGMLANVQTAMSECQIAEWRGKTGRLTGFDVDGERAPLDMNITEEAAAALPPWMPEPYRLSSGAAHSRPWVIGRGSVIAQERGTGEAYAGEAATVATSVMVAIAALGAAHEAWNQIFGLGRQDVAGTLQQRLEAYLHGVLFIYPPTARAE